MGLRDASICIFAAAARSEATVFALANAELGGSEIDGTVIDLAWLLVTLELVEPAVGAEWLPPNDFSWLASSNERKSIGATASRLGISREHFTRSFRDRVGMSPNAFRIIRRLNRARDQIRAGVSVAAVAADCGFADQSHLGRHFRRVFGTTPRAYLNAMSSSQTFQTA